MYKALRMNITCKLKSGLENEWVSICRHKYLEGKKNFLSFFNPPNRSAFYNGILDIQDCVWKHLWWEVSKGDIVIFWEDIWIRDTLLLQDNALRSIMEWTKIHLDLEVKNYISYVEGISRWMLSLALNLKIISEV